MRRAIAIIVMAAVASIAATRPLAQVTSWPANLLRVSVLVSDGSGKPATGLRESDFEVIVDGQAAPIAEFTAEPTDLAVSVLIDITSSLHENPNGVAGLVSSTRTGTGAALSGPEHPEFIQPAVGPFELKGTRAGDRVRLGAITRKPMLSSLLDGGSPEVGKVWKAFFDLPPVEWLGPSPIFDATSDAAASVASFAGQRAVILMTDGLASRNKKGYRDVAAEAAFAGVSISVIAEPAVPPQIVTAARDPLIPLRTLADATGGLYLVEGAATYRQPTGQSWAAGQRAQSFQRVLDHLHRSYAIGIAPVADGRLHKLDVRVKKPNLFARARKGYVRSTQD